MASLTLNGGQGLFTWKITELGNPFNTTYYMSAGITKTPFTDGATSVSAFDTITASSSGSSTTVGPTTVYCDPGTYTIYGWTRAANGKYYNSGSGTVTVTGGGTTTYYYRCYDQTNSKWIDSGTSSSSSSITRPTKSEYTYKGYSTGASYDNALSYGIESTSTTATATSNYPYVCFYYEKSSGSSWSEYGSYTSLSSDVSSSVSCGITQYKYKVFRIAIPADVKGTCVFTCRGQNGSSNVDIVVNTPGSFSSSQPSMSFGTNGKITSGTAVDSQGSTSTAESLTITISSTSTSTRYYWVAVTGYNGAALGTLYYTLTYDLSGEWTLSSQNAGTSITNNYSKTFSTLASKTTIRTSVSFSKSGTATFYTTGSNDTYGYLSTSSTFNDITGKPSSYITYNDDGVDGNNCKITYSVTAGTTYYFWVKQYSGSTISNSMVVHIDPPAPTYELSISYNGRSLVNAQTIDSSSVLLYLGSTNIGTVSSGSTKKLNTKNKFVTSNIKIHNTTLNCANKFMEDDVTVTVSSG